MMPATLSFKGVPLSQGQPGVNPGQLITAVVDNVNRKASSWPPHAAWRQLAAAYEWRVCHLWRRICVEACQAVWSVVKS